MHVNFPFQVTPKGAMAADRVNRSPCHWFVYDLANASSGAMSFLSAALKASM